MHTGYAFGSFYSKLDQTMAASCLQMAHDGQILHQHEYSAILASSAEPLHTNNIYALQYIGTIAFSALTMFVG